MIYPLDKRKTKKTKTKPKPADFFVNTCISVIFFKKSQNNKINSSEKIQEITILFWVLVIGFMHLVSVDPMDRS